MDTRDIPIATPCGQDFRKMTPEAGGRFCADCKKVVRDLSAMPEEEARRLLAAPRTEGLCVRYLHDETGQLYFADRPPPVAAQLLNRARRAALIAMTPALAACSSGGVDGDSLGASAHAARRADPTKTTHVYENMGGVPAPNDPYPLPTADASVDGATVSSDDAAADGGAPADAGPASGDN